MKVKQRVLATLLCVLLAFSTFSAYVYTDFGGNEEVVHAAEAVTKPKASLKSGTYTVAAAKKVTLTCADENAKIYYKLNSAKYKRYTKAISITKNSTLKVYAVVDGKKSEVVTYKYKLTPKINVSVEEGTYTTKQWVGLSSKLKNVTYYYTLDGTKPTKNSTKCTGEIYINQSCTLRVLAVKSGWTNKYYTFDYVIDPMAKQHGEAYLNVQNGVCVDAAGQYFAEINSSDVYSGNKRLASKSYKTVAYLWEFDTSDDILLLSIENYESDYKMKFEFNPEELRSGDHFTLDNFYRHDSGADFSIWNYNLEGCDRDFASVRLNSEYFEKVDVTVEYADATGICALVFDVQFQDGRGKSYTYRGMITHDFGDSYKQYESTDYTNNGEYLKAAAGQYTSKDGRHTAAEEECSLLMDGKQITAEASHSVGRSDMSVFIKGLGDNRQLTFTFDYAKLKSGDQFKLENFNAKVCGTSLTVVNFPLTEKWTDGKHFSTKYGRNFIKSLEVLVEHYNENGVLSLSFDAVLHDGMGNETKLDGFLVTRLGTTADLCGSNTGGGTESKSEDTSGGNTGAGDNTGTTTDTSDDNTTDNTGESTNTGSKYACSICEDTYICHLCDGSGYYFNGTCGLCHGTLRCSFCQDVSGGTSVDIYVPTVCGYCNGGRICPVCYGRGGISVPTYGTGGTGWVNCSACNGSRMCKWCGGTGR